MSDPPPIRFEPLRPASSGRMVLGIILGPILWLLALIVAALAACVWAQRKRGARGQGEVLHAHLSEVLRWRNRGMWPLGLESLASLLWMILFVASLVVAVFGIALGGRDQGSVTRGG